MDDLKDLMSIVVSLACIGFYWYLIYNFIQIKRYAKESADYLRYLAQMEQWKASGQNVPINTTVVYQEDNQLK